MSVITTPLGCIGLFSVVYLGLLLARFTRRLTAVTKTADTYRWFIVANAFIAMAMVSQLMRGIAGLAPGLAPPMLLAPWFALASFHIPLAVGLTLELVLVWRNWNWILREKIE